MKKEQTTVYLFKEVKVFAKKFKINLSEWVNTEFCKQFLSLDSKKKQRDLLDAEIKAVEERLDVMDKSLTAREQRYICQVMPRIREGKELTSMWRWFNNEYGREFTIDQFQALVQFYEKQAVQRVKHAIIEKEKERKK